MESYEFLTMGNLIQGKIEPQHIIYQYIQFFFNCFHFFTVSFVPGYLICNMLVCPCFKQSALYGNAYTTGMNYV